MWLENLNEEEKSYKMDYLGAAIIGIATILAATSAYYSALWGGHMSQKYTGAVTTLTEASNMYLQGLSDMNTFEFRDFQDGIMFSQFQLAEDRNDEENAKFYKGYLSEPFKNMIEVDGTDEEMEALFKKYDDSHATAIKDYETRIDSSIVLWGESYDMINEGDEANSHGDKFTLSTVLFTVVLFFAGMSAAARKYKLKLIYMVFSAVTFLASVIYMLTIPFP
jgi:hypothetical protein